MKLRDNPNRSVSPGLRRRVKESYIREVEERQGYPVTALQRASICGYLDRELDELEREGLLG